MNPKMAEAIVTENCCPKCGGTLTLLGLLFEMIWCKCQQCGLEFKAGVIQPTEEITSGTTN